MTKKILLIIILIIIFSLIYWHQVNSPVNLDGKEQKFSVNNGESIKQIAQHLVDADLIKSKLFFRYITWRKKANLLAGDYLLSQKMSTREIVDILIKGEVTNKERTITIIEGWQIDDINKYLKDNKVISDDSFLKLTKADVNEWQFKFSKPEFLNDISNQADLEGYLFPDTYRIFKNATASEIINKMLDNFNSKVTQEMKQEIIKQGKTIHQIITLASIIEKEVRTSEDMKKVAGIFWDRLKSNIALQSDATLTYVLDENKTRHSAEELRIDSPYNTYKYPGLPPGPICNPGLNAIISAIYPQHTEYNYFLSRPDTGETVYSKTLEEHNKNKAKYLK